MLFVGLGNIGTRFTNTRHNFGIATLRDWVGENESAVKSGWKTDASGKWASAKLVFGDCEITVMFPLTMMNNSGEAVGEFIRYERLDKGEILLVHDDMELPLGEIRLGRGSAKGHNGVRSVQTALGSKDVRRLRLGIGRPPQNMEAEEYVLQKFSAAERETMSKQKLTAMASLTKVAVLGELGAGIGTKNN